RDPRHGPQGRPCDSVTDSSLMATCSHPEPRRMRPDKTVRGHPPIAAGWHRLLSILSPGRGRALDCWRLSGRLADSCRSDVTMLPADSAAQLAWPTPGFLMTCARTDDTPP